MGKGKKGKGEKEARKKKEKKRGVYFHGFNPQMFDPVWGEIVGSSPSGMGTIVLADPLSPPNNECRALVPYGYCFDSDEEQGVSLEYAYLREYTQKVERV